MEVAGYKVLSKALEANTHGRKWGTPPPRLLTFHCPGFCSSPCQSWGPSLSSSWLDIFVFRGHLLQARVSFQHHISSLQTLGSLTRFGKVVSVGSGICYSFPAVPTKSRLCPHSIQAASPSLQLKSLRPREGKELAQGHRAC